MIDWSEVFRLGDPLGLIVRGTAIYWFLFVLFRFVLRRDAGSMGIADLLMIVLIADASQNAMAGSYESVSDGFVLVATLIFWNYLFDALAYRSERLRRFLQPQPLLMVKDGRMLRRNMRRELVTDEELQAMLRENGIEDMSEVKSAHMESDGQISVIRNEPHAGGAVKSRASRRKAKVL